MCCRDDDVIIDSREARDGDIDVMLYVINSTSGVLDSQVVEAALTQYSDYFYETYGYRVIMLASTELYLLLNACTARIQNFWRENSRNLRQPSRPMTR